MNCEQELTALREAIRNERKTKGLRRKSWPKCWKYRQLM